MRVGVGSTNPVKVEATERAFSVVSNVSVEGTAVSSGVREQPRGEGETITGAENRARNALDADGYDLGVGLEGGVAEVEEASGLFVIMWGAVTDGRTLERGAGPRLRLPGSIADRVRDGEELGPVLDDALDRGGVKREEGAAGVLTGNVIDRRSALRHAIAGALGPFVTDRY